MRYTLLESGHEKRHEKEAESGASRRFIDLCSILMRRERVLFCDTSMSVSSRLTERHLAQLLPDDIKVRRNLAEKFRRVI